MDQTSPLSLAESGSPYPRPGESWWMVAVLFLTALVSYTDRLVLGVLVDPLRRDLGLSDSGVSLLQGAAFTIIYVVASLPAGRLADRGRRRAVLIGGALLWCFAAILCGLSPDFRTLFVGRLLIGVGEAALVPSAVSMIADAFPTERRGLAIGLLAMGTIIGGPLGISVGGLLLSAANAGHFAGWPFIGTLAPWRIVLVVIGMSGLVSPLLLLSVHEPVRRGTRAQHSLRDTVGYFRSTRGLLIPLYLACALLAIGDYGLLSWAPTTLGRRFAWSADRIGVAYGLITAVAGIIGAVVGGWISDMADRRGGVTARVAVCIAAALIATLATLLVSVPIPDVVLLSIGLWTFASAIAGTGGVAALQQVLPAHYRATGMSIFTFCNTLVGLGAGPTIVAATAEHLYSGPAALSFAISSAVGPAAIVASAVFAVGRIQLRRTPSQLS